MGWIDYLRRRLRTRIYIGAIARWRLDSHTAPLTISINPIAVKITICASLNNERLPQYGFPHAYVCHQSNMRQWPCK
jgi:hypothetical protein